MTKSKVYLLESISSLPRHEFWGDDASYLDIPTKGIGGHRQVTHAYFVVLARKHGSSVGFAGGSVSQRCRGVTMQGLDADIRINV